MTGLSDNSHLPSADPLAKWMSSFKVVYALTHQSVDELSSIETGILRKECGEGLQVRKITPEMLKNDLRLAGEIHHLALSGHLGYAQENGRIQFRQDIAEKIGTVRAFKVMTETPDIFENLEVEIDAIDHETYASLHLPESETEEIAEEKEKKLEKKQQEDSKKTHRQSSTPTNNKQPFITLLNRIQRLIQTVRYLLEQLRSNEKNRRDHAAKEREADKQREREAIEDEILMREIIKDETLKPVLLEPEIKASVQRADRNFGDRKESLTNSSNRSTVAIQEIHKADQIESQDTLEPPSKKPKKSSSQ